MLAGPPPPGPRGARSKPVSPTVTAILMAVLFVAICALDVYLALDGRDGNTYSERLRALWPPAKLLLVFGMGLLAGHLYW